MKSNLKKITALLTALIMVLSFTACSSSSDSDGESADVQTVVVGTDGEMNGFTYLDEETDELTGYEIEVLKYIDEQLPQYEFDFEIYGWEDLLLAMDQGKVDIGVDQFEKNAEREEKYLFSSIATSNSATYVAVESSRDDITGIDDLQGKTVLSSNGGMDQFILEEYNSQHEDNPIIVDPNAIMSAEEVVAGLQNGKWDATLYDTHAIQDMNSAFEDSIKAVGDPVYEVHGYYAFAKDDQELCDAVSEVLEQMQADGTLSEICQKYLEADYSQPLE